MTQIASSTATPRRGQSAKHRGKGNPLTRIALFYRQVIAELRKVVWPSRNELVTYTIVVLVFVVIVIAIVSVLDFVFSKAVLTVLG